MYGKPAMIDIEWVPTYQAENRIRVCFRRIIERETKSGFTEYLTNDYDCPGDYCSTEPDFKQWPRVFIGIKEKDYAWPPKHYHWMTKERHWRPFSCSIKGCLFSCDRQSKLDMHIKQCRNDTEVKSKFKVWGEKEKPFKMLIEEGYLDADFKLPGLYATYDTETLDVKMTCECPEDTVELRLVSAAVGSNIAGDKPRFFIRQDSTYPAVQEMVDDMLDHLRDLADRRKNSFTFDIDALRLQIGETIKQLKEKERLKSELNCNTNF